MAQLPHRDERDASPHAEAIDWPAELARHDRWLRTIVRARLGEAQAVDDVMQEVSLAAVKQAAPIRDSAKTAPWLYRLAVRQCLLYRRKMGRQRKLVDRYGEQVLPVRPVGHTPEPIDWLLADERQRLVREAIARLSDRDAELLMLKYTENWSYRQIAEHLGATHSAIESRLHRARAKLREELTAANVVEAH